MGVPEQVAKHLPKLVGIHVGAVIDVHGISKRQMPQRLRVRAVGIGRGCWRRRSVGRVQGENDVLFFGLQFEGREGVGDEGQDGLEILFESHGACLNFVEIE